MRCCTGVALFRLNSLGKIHHAGSDSLRDVRLLWLHALGPASTEAEGVFPAGLCTQHTCTCICACTHGQPHRPQTDAWSAHTNTNNTNSLIPLRTLADHHGGPLVRTYICTAIHAVWVPPSAGLYTQSAHGSQSPQLLTPRHTSVQCWPVLMGFTPGQWVWGSPGTALGGT